MRKFYALDTFDEGTDPAPESVAQPAPAAPPAPVGGYSMAQAEEIANARAERATRSALASYFKQQGLDEAQVTEAIKAYKEAIKAKEPDVAAITKQRDDALAELAEHKRKESLAAKGVKPEYAGYVAFEAQKLMASDKALDTFEKAVDKFMKDNPQYAAQKQAYRVKTSADQGSGSSQGKAAGGAGSDAWKAELNAALKGMAKRR